MPVFWLSLSQTTAISGKNSMIVFLILHGLVYPASNGYNSYMDRDTSSIGGVKNPKMPTKQLFYVSVLLDMLALLFSLYIKSL
jgi:1,4-dihydroxy-2-naphthoate polyprenyltransferase